MNAVCDNCGWKGSEDGAEAGEGGGVTFSRMISDSPGCSAGVPVIHALSWDSAGTAVCGDRCVTDR